MLNNKTGILVLTAASILAACAPGVSLKNPDTGEVAQCKITQIASDQVHQQLMRQCLDDYRREGYVVLSASELHATNNSRQDVAAPQQVVANNGN